MTSIEQIWQDAFNHCIGEQQERSGDTPFTWKASGRKSKEWPDKENGDWWSVKGPEMLHTFINAWREQGWQVWTTPEGIPAIELNINMNYGDVLVKTFIDLVAVTPDGELVIVDWKTGSNIPTNAMQLGLYCTAVEKQFGIKPANAYFYDARNGEFKQATDLHLWTFPLFVELFAKFEIGLQNNLFLPNVNMMCSYCSVKDYCYATGGKLAHLADPLYTIAKATTIEGTK